jgi:FG-GAP-like repeat
MKTVARLAGLVSVLSALVALPLAQSAAGALFGTDALPTSKEECKSGGWRRFGVFNNQGDCVSFVATGGKNPPAMGPPPPIFAPPAYYGVGGSFQTASGDYNGDTHSDLAVTNASSNNVSVLLNNGDGTFTVPVSYGVAEFPYWLAAGDFDGDSDLDLAVTNVDSDNVSVLLNNGDGTFAAAANYDVGDLPFVIVVADFDGDTDRDLAVMNQASDNVSVLLNNGDGTFAAAANYGVDVSPVGTVFGDFDGDTDPDLAVANNGEPGSDNVSVLLNNGDGTFAAAANYDVGEFPEGIAIADFDGDTDLDLAVPNAFSDDVSVLLNNGNGSFAAAANYGVGDEPMVIAIGDFDGDTDADVAATNFSSHNVSVLLNNGDGTFAAAVHYGVGVKGPVGIHPWFQMAVEDFNRDAKPDVAINGELAMIGVLLHA